jgi:hypothetical protein
MYSVNVSRFFANWFARGYRCRRPLHSFEELHIEVFEQVLVTEIKTAVDLLQQSQSLGLSLETACA